MTDNNAERRKYKIPAVTIETLPLPSGSGWQAAIAEDPSPWESGETEVDAIGKLMVRLHHMVNPPWCGWCNRLQSDCSCHLDLTSVDKNSTDQDLMDAFESGNNAGNGFGAGEEYDTPFEAAEREEYIILRSIDGGTNCPGEPVFCEDDGNLIVICNIGGPWAVKVGQLRDAIETTSSTRWLITTDAAQQEIEADTADDAIALFAEGEFPGRKVTGESDLFTPSEIADGAWVRVEETGRI